MSNSNSNPSLDSVLLFERLLANEEFATEEVFQRHFESLRRVIQSKISIKLRSRIDAEDILQSTYRTFFSHARNQDYVIKRSGDLWRLLFTIAKNKLSHQIDRHQAAKRDTRNEESLPDSIASRTQDDATDLFIEELRILVISLEQRDQEILVARMQGESTKVIANQLQITDRTVRRRLALIEAKFKDCLS